MVGLQVGQSDLTMNLMWNTPQGSERMWLWHNTSWWQDKIEMPLSEIDLC